MRALRNILVIPALFVAHFHAFAQISLPRYPVQGQQPAGQVPPPPPATPGNTDAIRLSARLDETKRVLVILLEPAAVTKLLRYEDDKYGQPDSDQKLKHRRDAISESIKQLKAGCK
jgi:hypothetical protein